MSDNYDEAESASHARIVGSRTAIYIIFGLTGFGLTSWISRIPSARDSLQASSAQMGLLALALAAGSVVGLLVAGRVVARFQTKHVIFFSFLVSAMGLLAAGFGVSVTYDYGLTLFALTLLGLGTGLCNITVNVEGAVIERALHRPIMSSFHAAYSGGAIVGAGVGILAAFLHVGVVVHLGLSALSVVAISSSAVRKIQPHESPASASHITSVNRSNSFSAGLRRRTSPWREGRTLMISLAIFGTTFANGAASDWIPLAMVDGHGATNTVGVAAYGVFLASMIIARIGGVSLLARFGRVRVLQVSTLLACSGIVTFIFIPSSFVALTLGAAMWGLGIALGYPVAMSSVADDAVGAPARISIVATVGYAGSLIEPLVIGILAENFGILHSLMIVLFLVVIAGIVAPVLGERPGDALYHRAGLR